MRDLLPEGEHAVFVVREPGGEIIVAEGPAGPTLAAVAGRFGIAMRLYSASAWAAQTPPKSVAAAQRRKKGETLAKRHGAVAEANGALVPVGANATLEGLLIEALTNVGVSIDWYPDAATAVDALESRAGEPDAPHASDAAAVELLRRSSAVA